MQSVYAYARTVIYAFVLMAVYLRCEYACKHKHMYYIQYLFVLESAALSINSTSFDRLSCEEKQELKIFFIA